MKQTVKRTILILLAALMIFSLVFASASTAFAQDKGIGSQNVLTTADGFEYTLSEDKVTITGYSGEGTEIVIPAEIDGLPVVAIANSAFEAKTSITEVTLPDSIVSVGENAFAQCEALVIVNIGSGLSQLDFDIFEGCRSLTAVFVSENNQNFASENGVLFSRDKTRLVYYPQGDSREAYEIPEGVKTVGHGAFAGSNRLKNVKLPASLEKIEARAFLGCENLESMQIPSGVLSIGEYALASLTALKEISLPASLPEISEAMLSQCTSLVKVEIPASVKKIGADAFSYCTALGTITLPEGVTEIGDGAFTKCKALTSITLPASLVSIPASAFATCDALKTVNFAGTEGQWHSLNCSLGNAMIVYNFVYGSDDTSSKPSDETVSENQNVSSDNLGQTQASSPEVNSNTSSGDSVSSQEEISSDAASQIVSKPQNSDTSSNTFIASGENVTFYKDDILSLSGDKNALPENTVITCREIGEGIDFVRVKAAVKERTTQFEVYDIDMKVQGVSTKPAAAIKAEFKIPEGYDPNKAQIIYVSDRGGAVELKSKVNKKDNTVSADITETGTYVVAEMLHNTQGMSVGSVTLIIAAIVAAGLVLFYLLVYKPKRQKPE